MFFNGGTRTVGTTPPPYPRYRETIEGLAGQQAELSVTPSLVSIVGQDKAEIGIILEIGEGESIENPEECTVRALVYEDMVSSGGTYNHVVRVVPVEVTLPISESAQTVTINDEIDIDPSWKEEDLFIVAWVQRDTNKSILNAALRKITDSTPVESSTWGSVKAGFRSANP